MKTKEEILQKHIAKCMSEKSVLEAMEEYAKQEALAFYEWDPIHGLSEVLKLGKIPNREDAWHAYQQSKPKKSN